MSKDGNLRTKSACLSIERYMDRENCSDRNRKYWRKSTDQVYSDLSRSPSRSRSPNCGSSSTSHEEDRSNIKYREERMHLRNILISEKCGTRKARKDCSDKAYSEINWGIQEENIVSKGVLCKKVKDKYNDKLNPIIIDNCSQLNAYRARINLEAKMQKRRERLELWKAARCKSEVQEIVTNEGLLDNKALQKQKQNSLGAETDDIDEKAENLDQTLSIIGETSAGISTERVENEEDSLDIFMQGIQEDVQKENHREVKAGPENLPQLAEVQTETAKKLDIKDKGEIMEQNPDGMDYSSEEDTDYFEMIRFNMNTIKSNKDLAKIDHSTIDYFPFRKNFYIEVPELARMTQEMVEAYKCELGGIRVRGRGCPKPIKTWAQAGVSKKEMDLLKKLAFEKPTPIQCQAIPVIMSGRDLIGIAKTGSGKTLAFLLPMFRHILDQLPLEKSDGPISIIMAPTRELCLQIGKDAKRICKYLNLKVVCLYGGAGISEQISELKRGAEIVVCTPGRMIDILTTNSGRVTNLRRCTYVVLDEADRLLDMGFEPQVMRIVDTIRPDRQTVMFSATFPRQMEALARKTLINPIEVQVEGPSAVCKEVEQHVIVLEENMKFLKLLELLGNYQQHGSVIVFVDKQENADLLLKDLLNARYPCSSLHGGIDQQDRYSIISNFKSGKSKLLVATSVAARGLDIKNLILVVNYDCPNHYEDYVHRCGRTGRAGNKGFAFTFLTPDQERFSPYIKNALETSGSQVPIELTQVLNSYRERQKSEGKSMKSGGGFSGKGYKFDETEVQLVNELKIIQKHALGLQGSDDESIEEAIEQKVKKMTTERRVEKDAIIDGAIIPKTTMCTTVALDAYKSDLENKITSRALAEGSQKPESTATALMNGNLAIIKSRLAANKIAQQLAARLNKKLNYQPHVNVKQKDASLPVLEKYEEQLEINDFPQQVRFRITSRSTLSQIAENSGTCITVRGTFVDQMNTAPEGGRRLYLAIEAISELSVRNAKKEICEILKEEMLKIQTSVRQLVRGSLGRYKVF